MTNKCECIPGIKACAHCLLKVVDVFTANPNEISSKLADTHRSYWEDYYAINIGMCCVGCICGHCVFLRNIINKIIHEAEQKVVSQTEKALKRKRILWWRW